MRILIVDTCYPPFLEHHYRSNPSLERESYDVQWRALMDTFFGTADAYSHYLGLLGHDAHEVVANCEPLQAAWAREHGLRGRRRRLRAGPPTREDVVRAQVESCQPDVLYVQNHSVLDAEVLRDLGRGRLVVGQVATELPTGRQLRAFDLLLTSFPHFVDRFRAAGLASQYFRIGFDPRALDRLGEVDTRYEAVFVGALGRTQHVRSNDLVERAAARVPIDVWGYDLEERGEQSPLRRRYHGEAWGVDMLRVLAQARIALNRHGEVAEDSANNMRLYEATGAGTLLLTDEKRNLGELFEIGREVVAYRDEDGLVDAIEHYLAHEDERAAIAAAGQRRTLCDHTYEVRMRELVDILDSYLR